MLRMKRLFDLFVLILVLPLIFFPAVMVALVVVVVSGFPILYWSDRVGKNGELFRMPKFRTMLVNTPVVATDQLNNPASYLIPMGSLMRKLSLDEFPQLWTILIGKMSFVGPRPALFNQHQLIQDRSRLGIDSLLPGLTGWAQVNGRDDLSDEQKVAYDYEYLQNQSLLMDTKIIWLTVLRVIKRDGVSH